jgi:hypothetical protein
MDTIKKSKKNAHNYMAVYKPSGCAVIDNAVKTPTPIYYFAYTANQGDNVDAEADMTRISGILNLMQSEVGNERIMKELESNLFKYSHLKITQNENKTH